jgi:hypothetical protein
MAWCPGWNWDNSMSYSTSPTPICCCMDMANQARMSTQELKQHNIWLDESVPPVHYIMTQSKYSQALTLLSSGFAHTFNALHRLSKYTMTIAVVMVPVYTRLDPQRVSYSFGYGSSLVPGRTQLYPAGVVLFAISASVAVLRRGGVMTAISSKTSEGGRPSLQVFALELLGGRSTRGRSMAASWWRLRMSESVLA